MIGRVASTSVQMLGVNRVVRSLKRKSLPVLCYHGVVSDDISRGSGLYGNVMGVTEFTRQLEETLRCFQPIHPSDLAAWREGALKARRNPVLITFDDGYRNNLTIAAPILLRLGAPALFLIATGYIGTNRILWPDEVYLRVMHWPEPVIPLPGGAERYIPETAQGRRRLAGDVREWCKRIPDTLRLRYLTRLRKHELPEVLEEPYAFLSWSEVLELHQRGFTIGSHTVEHPILTRVTHAQLEFELTESKAAIESLLASPCRYFSYPNGGALEVSSAVADEVRRAGYAFAFTVRGLWASADDDPFTMDRVYVPAGISAAEFHARLSGLRGTVKRWLAK